jgi:hypothetical protein
MNSIYASIVLFFFLSAAQAQTPTWEWARCAGGSTGSAGDGIGADANGNIYVVGRYGIGSVAFGSDTLTANNYYHIFITKYNSSGDVIWSKSAGGGGFVYVNGIKTDGYGNTYIAGYFSSDTIILGNYTLTRTSGPGNSFIAKYDSSGTMLWAKSAKGRYNYISNISVDGNDYVYATGSFYDSVVVFDHDTLRSYGANLNLFITKYNSSGDVIWAKTTGGSFGNKWSTAVSTDGFGNAYITGRFRSSNIVFGNDTLQNKGYHDYVFIAKYNPSGKLVWARSSGGTANSTDTKISTDINGDSYITGMTDDSTVISFGTDSISNTSYPFFIVKYNALGNEIWMKGGNAISGEIRGITADRNGNAYITGTFIRTIVFGSDTLSHAEDNSAFIAKYNSAGSLSWAESVGKPGNVCCININSDIIGNLYLTGALNSTILTSVFGTDTLTASNTLGNAFLAKIANSSSVVTSMDRIVVYPNPSNETFYFHGIQNGASILIFNLLGEMIYTGIANSDRYSVDLSGQAKGMYLYSIKANSGIVQQGKIVLEQSPH